MIVNFFVLSFVVMVTINQFIPNNIVINSLPDVIVICFSKLSFICASIIYNSITVNYSQTLCLLVNHSLYWKGVSNIGVGFSHCHIVSILFYTYSVLGISITVLSSLGIYSYYVYITRSKARHVGLNFRWKDRQDTYILFLYQKQLFSAFVTLSILIFQSNAFFY